MPKGFKHILSSFFAHKLTTQVKELYSSTLILNFAIASVAIFEPIFLYLTFLDKYGLSRTLQLIMLFYLGVYTIYFFLMPLGAKFASRFGYETSIAVGTIFTAIFYISLFGVSYDVRLIFVSVVAYALWKVFYWPAYHSDFAHFSVDGEQGRQISNLLALESIVFITGPLIGGFILKFAGFNVLFILAAIIMILSNIPMLLTREKFKPASFSYFDSYKRLFAKKKRKKMFAIFGFGEELLAGTIWPIFIFIVIDDLLGLGILTSVSIFITTMLFLYIGKMTDKGDGRGVLRYGTVLYFFSWVLRLVSRGVIGVFLLDSYSRIAKQSIVIPMTALTYEKAQDTSVMKTVLFFEMSLVLGKITIMLIALVLLQFFVPGWNVMFILAGLTTLLYLLF
jgi:MFS family permease